MTVEQILQAVDKDKALGAIDKRMAVHYLNDALRIITEKASLSKEILIEDFDSSVINTRYEVIRLKNVSIGTNNQFVDMKENTNVGFVRFEE